MIWTSKSPRWFVGLDLKTKQASVCRLRHKIDERCNGVGHASRSSGCLSVNASQARVFQSDLKTGGCATAGGARGSIAEVILESS
jgi:hypothetical protein